MVKRYVTTCDCMSQAAWGDYVRYDDYATLEAELAKLKGEYEWVASINTALDESNQSAWAENAKLRAELERREPDGWKLVPVEPTPEMVSAAEEAHMPFGDMDIALRMAILAAPSAPKADDPVKVWADMLYVTHRPLIRNAISLLRMRRPVAPDVESVASDLEEMIAGMPTPAVEPRSAWMEVAALTEPAHEPVNKRLLEALEDVLWCIDTGPSCQIGVSNRCKCSMCVTGRIRAAIAAARKG